MRCVWGSTYTLSVEEGKEALSAFSVQCAGSTYTLSVEEGAFVSIQCMNPAALTDDNPFASSRRYTVQFCKISAKSSPFPKCSPISQLEWFIWPTVHSTHTHNLPLPDSCLAAVLSSPRRRSSQRHEVQRRIALMVISSICLPAFIYVPIAVRSTFWVTRNRTMLCLRFATAAQRAVP
jgi:hypothetical protein